MVQLQNQATADLAVAADSMAVADTEAGIEAVVHTADTEAVVSVAAALAVHCIPEEESVA